MQFLAVHKTDNPCPVGWDCGNPSTFTAEALREIKKIIGTSGCGKRQLAVAYTYSYARYPIENIVESIMGTIAAVREENMPVIFHLDGVNWWNAHPELWNWFDPAARGYDPANIANVERYDWGEDTAVRIGWRNWGSQIRVLPAPNLASPAFLKLQYTMLDEILPLIHTFAQESPHLFGGIVFGWELSPYVQAYYYENGNECPAHPASEDPAGGVAESIALGYAAAAALGYQSEGILTAETVDKVCTWYLDQLISHAEAHGFAREQIITHSYYAGETARGGSHSGAASVRPGVLPGWSFYGGDIAEMHEQIAMAGEQWALIECRPWELNAQFFRDVYNTNCRIINIFNWESIREDENAIQAIREIL